MGFSVGVRMGPVRVSNKGISAGVSAGPVSYSGFRRWGGRAPARRRTPSSSGTAWADVSDAYERHIARCNDKVAIYNAKIEAQRGNPRRWWHFLG
jgi:hypothetical protein